MGDADALSRLSSQAVIGSDVVKVLCQSVHIPYDPPVFSDDSTLVAGCPIPVVDLVERQRQDPVLSKLILCLRTVSRFVQKPRRK